MAAESVTPGHPDKIADQIADAYLDAALAENPLARVACEVLVSHHCVYVAGEVSGAAPHVRPIVYDVLAVTGQKSWDGSVETDITEQSRNIADHVASGGAGDQVIVYGYACVETDQLLPQEVVDAHNYARILWGLFEKGLAGADGKVLIVPETVFLSVSAPSAAARCLLETYTGAIISPFEIGGPQADTGLTGRKTQVDTYGTHAHHGGGAFSGKDPTKLDRSGAYMARYLARYLLQRFGVEAIEVCLVYGFGIARPLHVSSSPIDFGAHLRTFDLRPEAIIERFQLRRPIYRETANFGHFGRPTLPWEAA